jgi:hypothetical protein
MNVFGIDPSTDGAAFALLKVGRLTGQRDFIENGELTLDELDARLVKYAGDQQDARARGLTTFDCIVAVERPSGIHIHPPKPGPAAMMLRDYATKLMMARSSGTALMNASYVAGGIVRLGKHLGLRVVELAPQQWRTAIGASRSTKGTDQDAMVRDAIQTLIAGWPKRSNNHVRDAAGVALAAWWQVNAERRTGT